MSNSGRLAIAGAVLVSFGLGTGMLWIAFVGLLAILPALSEF
jgi:hypothetical protein